MKKLTLTLALLLALFGAGCGGTGTTKFVHPEFDFSFVESVAVIPFENLSDSQGSGAQATRYFITSLLSSDAFVVIEPGEVARALETQSLVRTAQLSVDQIKAVGRDLGVQGLFLGTVSESASLRSGSTTVSVVTVVLRLVETETGATVWSATNSDDSSGFWSTLFGTGQKSRSEVMRRCIDGCLDTLLD